MTLNNHWGYHRGDHNWKSPKTVAMMLEQVAAAGGNLLLNVGPKGDGAIPAPTVAVLDRVGEWLRTSGEGIFGAERFDYNLRRRGNERSDWSNHGVYTARGNHFYLHVNFWPGPTLTIAGLECAVTDVADASTGEKYEFSQEGGKLVVSGLPDDRDTEMPALLRFATLEAPCIYLTGGHRTPSVPHCRYDPVESEIQH